LTHAGLTRKTGHTGAVTLIRRFGSALSGVNYPGQKTDNYLGRCDGDRFGYVLGLTLALPAAAALRR
jgi:hypothetical protein